MDPLRVEQALWGLTRARENCWQVHEMQGRLGLLAGCHDFGEKNRGKGEGQRGQREGTATLLISV